MADFMGKKLDLGKLERERFRSARIIKKFRHAEPEKTFAPSMIDVEFRLKKHRAVEKQQKARKETVFEPWMLEVARRVNDGGE